MSSTSFPRDAGDWQGRFIFDLARTLGSHPSATLSLWAPPGDLPPGVVPAQSEKESAWLKEMSVRGGIAHLLRNRPLSGAALTARIIRSLRAAARRERPDIHHTNWLQLALGVPDDGRPIYSSVLGSDFGLLRLPGMKPLLRRIYAGHPTILAPNAGWMQTPLIRAFGDIAEIIPNPFGVNDDWYAVPRPAADSRQWLVVSRVTRNKLGELLSWGEGLFDADRRLILLGPMQEQIELPDWIDYQGATDPTALREHWFPRASGLLTLSRHAEGRPQVMIEAMAAGLPVIASDMPAHADFISDRETGWLVGSREQLQLALDDAERPGNADAIGQSGRHWMRKNIGTWDDHARRCLDGYRSLTHGVRHAN